MAVVKVGGGGVAGRGCHNPNKMKKKKKDPEAFLAL